MALQKRRNFIKQSSFAGIGMALTGRLTSLYASPHAVQGKRVGIIGLDTSHSVEFTKVLNGADASAVYHGYRIVAAYPNGSLDIESSVSRIPGYIDKVRAMGVEIVGSIDELLEKTDVILLETNDGRRHLEQVLPVYKSGKPVFIDKPIAASLSDTISIYEAAKQYNVPVFSSSTLRFMSSAQDVAKGKIGKVLGADAYSPCVIEKTHPDLFWYGVHGVEILYTVMGTGCKEVSRVYSENTDIVTGRWNDGRLGTFRGTRTGKHSYGGTAFGEKGNAVIGPIEGYEPLLIEIVKFFETGISPIPPEETIEMFTFMQAADESKKRNGAVILLDNVMKQAQKEAQAKLKMLQ